MGSLFVVSTPIGNLQDIPFRALHVLRSADIIFAEDTRRARILLTHHEITGTVRSLYAQNERRRVAEVCAILHKCQDVALLSDAGTPLISDPGNHLVAKALEEGFRVVPIPGASAVLSALVISGLPVIPFVFLGFPPRRTGARKALFESYRDRSETLVIFESPRRLVSTLGALADALGERRASVARELTKVYEEARRGLLPDLAERFATGVRGEVTIVVEGAPKGGRKLLAEESRDTRETVDGQIASLLDEGLSCKEVAAQIAEDFSYSKREIYARALAVKGEQ